MRDRKQRSTIDAVLSLVQNIKIANSQDNTLFCLLLNVQEVFDHVSLQQLLQTL